MNKILIISFICSISFGILSGAEQKFIFDKEAYSFDNIVQEELFYSLLVELRCPKCQSSNLSGSNSPLSNDLKREVYELVIKEKSAEEIKILLRDMAILLFIIHRSNRPLIFYGLVLFF